MIRRFFHYMWEAFKNLKRNGLMTIASVFSVTVTLTLVGIFAAVLLNTEKLARGIEENIQINVFLRVDTYDQDKEVKNDVGQMVPNENYQVVQKAIEVIQGVDTVTFSSKEQELKKLQERMGDAWRMFDGDANPLSDVYVVQTTSPKEVASVTEEISKIKGVDRADYGKADTEKIFKMASFIRVWGFGAILLLAFVALFMISNTIRITIISRRHEIQIMRLVGAKNSYIRGPFFMEGAWVGLLGTIIPAVILYIGYQYAYNSFQKNLSIEHLSMYDPNPYSYYAIGALFLVGILVGSMGSVLSIRRYLKV
ncbi:MULTISPECIES: permease-like cell division protein FtsX [Streptococcus]|uniref:Cell division protein FtsX n=1 Tax=Streptococcus caledonicus TaxID=2614158 RepID=A0ABW0UAH1_9STRE|nr:permease-like cell division protein FtsX [Streptococcus sp. S784/96/1]